MVFSKLIKSSPFRGLGGLCFMLFICCFQPAQAQTFSEWWFQKKTQIKYLGLQIAALEQYGSYVKQGYNIAHNGLRAISGFTGDEKNLHSIYYNSLKTVNPAIKDNPQAAAIAAYASAIPSQFDRLNTLNGLDAGSRKYIASVKNNLLAECDADITELELVMTSGYAEMTDDERLKRLDQISQRMKDKYAFTMTFCNQVKTLLLQRNEDSQNTQTLRRYYGIN
ncbi:hypothetical protein [Mucilaginibacter paludis]|uniref:Uncharacterized protein n=1 Tax=Mucilaginibacter paludis DSM 18603 TaxID=714943 RepID=H1YIB1_9SPHI|nr:hypothetical protein [Mucilaginibacter paludis]EHQ27524.1 hypothetical protein Mucpa_3425 [Mucilaginibacter paludis DSM 18603]